MKATTKIQAERIAEAGFNKMTAEKYQTKGSSIKALIGKQYTIVNKESGDRYTVSVDPNQTYCTCKFFRENREHGTCKHILWCQQEAADEARYQDMADAMEAAC